MKIKILKEAKKFESFTLTIKVESQKELDTLWTIVSTVSTNDLIGKIKEVKRKSLSVDETYNILSKLSNILKKQEN